MYINQKGGVLPCVTDSEMDTGFRADAGRSGVAELELSSRRRPMKKDSGDQSEMPTMGLKIQYLTV